MIDKLKILELKETLESKCAGGLKPTKIKGKGVNLDMCFTTVKLGESKENIFKDWTLNTYYGVEI